jgi:hypothetical protein
VGFHLWALAKSVALDDPRAGRLLDAGDQAYQSHEDGWAEADGGFDKAI